MKNDSTTKAHRITVEIAMRYVLEENWISRSGMVREDIRINIDACESESIWVL